MLGDIFRKFRVTLKGAHVRGVLVTSLGYVCLVLTHESSTHHAPGDDADHSYLESFGPSFLLLVASLLESLRYRFEHNSSKNLKVLFIHSALSRFFRLSPTPSSFCFLLIFMHLHFEGNKCLADVYGWLRVFAGFAFVPGQCSKFCTSTFNL